MTFGYDSAFGFSGNRQGVGSFAKDLLNRLRMMRAELEVSCGHEFNGVERTSLLTFFLSSFLYEKARERPIIFIAHSLGGIVVKKVWAPNAQI